MFDELIIPLVFLLYACNHTFYHNCYLGKACFICTSHDFYDKPPCLITFEVLIKKYYMARSGAILKYFQGVKLCTKLDCIWRVKNQTGHHYHENYPSAEWSKRAFLQKIVSLLSAFKLMLCLFEFNIDSIST